MINDPSHRAPADAAEAADMIADLMTPARLGVVGMRAINNVCEHLPKKTGLSEPEREKLMQAVKWLTITMVALSQEPPTSDPALFVRRMIAIDERIDDYIADLSYRHDAERKGKGN